MSRELEILWTSLQCEYPASNGVTKTGTTGYFFLETSDNNCMYSVCKFTHMTSNFSRKFHQNPLNGSWQSCIYKVLTYLKPLSWIISLQSPQKINIFVRPFYIWCPTFLLLNFNKVHIRGVVFTRNVGIQMNELRQTDRQKGWFLSWHKNKIKTTRYKNIWWNLHLLCLAVSNVRS